MTQQPRNRTARFLDALTHSGPGYDLNTPSPPHVRPPDSPEPTPGRYATPETASGPHTPAQRIRLDDLTSDQLDALYTERDQLLAELDGRDEEARERWIQKQLDETGIRALEFRNGAVMELEPARELVAHWVGAARTMLGNAPNYTETRVSMDVKVAESPETYAFVLQRVAPGALTPHEARRKAEAERDQLADLLRRTADLLDVTHRYRSQGGHDLLGVNLTCSGCALRDKIRAALDSAAQRPPAPTSHTGLTAPDGADQ